jgi:3-hydroxyacyl-CoA dehydrogenase
MQAVEVVREMSTSEETMLTGVAAIKKIGKEPIRVESDMPGFLLNRINKEQLDYGRLCKLEAFADLNEKTLDLLVNEAIHFAKGVLDPLNHFAEETPLSFDNWEVRCPKGFKEAFRQYGEDGWIAAICDPAYGGQGFPLMMRIIINDRMEITSESKGRRSLFPGGARLDR